ncbi:MAG TPA: hypothetical protein VMH91_03195 [Candidatus Paceibacterota bacterium]|nr:hypothetical protein [Candidatus Paceibacterota bacterium]
MTSDTDDAPDLDYFASLAVDRFYRNCWRITNSFFYGFGIYSAIILLLEVPGAGTTWFWLGAGLAALLDIQWSVYVHFFIRLQRGTFGIRPDEADMIGRAIDKWRDERGLENQREAYRQELWEIFRLQ